MLVIRIICLWLCSITVAAPTTDSTHTAIQQRENSDPPDCYPIERLETADVNPLDCEEALREMPVTVTLGANSADAVTGNFGNTAPSGSPFKLPRHFAKGNCMIGVTMAVPSLERTDKSSWNDIAGKAASIITTCVNLPEPARRGGTVTAGRRNQINIEVFKNAPHLAFLIPLNDFMNLASLLQAHTST